LRAPMRDGMRGGAMELKEMFDAENSVRDEALESLMEFCGGSG